MMTICNDGHDEVCYEARNCPVCVALENHRDETKDLSKTIEQLEEEVDSLKSQLEER